MNAEPRAIRKTLSSAFGRGLEVRVRRPGVYQVSVPSVLSDGDEAVIFVTSARDGKIAVTDLGHTLMRASYTQKLTPKATEAIARLAQRNGFELAEGEVRASVPPEELFAATLGMIQIQAQAEVAIVAPQIREERVQAFREAALGALRSTNLRLDVGYTDRAVDPDGLYPVDAIIRGRRWVGVALVANDNDATNAVLAKLKLSQSKELAAHHPLWAAIPRDIDALATTTRRRMINELIVLTSGLGETQPETLGRKLLDLAEPAIESS